MPPSVEILMLPIPAAQTANKAGMIPLDEEGSPQWHPNWKLRGVKKGAGNHGPQLDSHKGQAGSPLATSAFVAPSSPERPNTTCGWTGRLHYFSVSVSVSATNYELYPRSFLSAMRPPVN